ncbi:MAG: Gfo/Idh/MocA family oxidoreductase [Aliishimia sp.]
MALKAGLAGYGLAGRVFHAPLLPAAGIELAAVASSRTGEISADHPEATIYATAEDMFADARLDLVIIATPTPTHVALAKAALAAGKHVIVDKPFAPTAAEARDLFALAKASGRVLSCFQNRRWDGEFLTLKHLIAEGTLGDIHNFQSNFSFFKPTSDPDRWQDQDLPGVGVHYDLGTHVIDQAVALFGRPDWVEGEALAQRAGAHVPDMFLCRLGYGTMRCLLSGSYFEPDFRSKYVVQGAVGSYRKWHMDVQEDQLRAGLTPGDDGFGVETQDRWGDVTAGGEVRKYPTATGCHQQIYVDLVRAIEMGSDCAIKPDEVITTLEIIEAMVTSGQTGQRIAL